MLSRHVEICALLVVFWLVCARIDTSQNRPTPVHFPYTPLHHNIIMSSWQYARDLDLLGMLDIGSLLVITSSGVDDFQGVAREFVDNSALELARWDMALEEDVQFTVGTALWLGESEEGPCKAEEADTSPEL